MPDPATRLDENRRAEKKPLNPDGHAWHRQPGESWKAYEAFTNFLMLGPERTIGATARVLGKSESLLKRWSGQWHWQLRAAAYEEHYMLLRVESVEADRDDMYRRHANLANMGLSIVEGHFRKMVEEVQEAMEKNGKLPEHFKPDALVRLFDTAAKLDRMATIGRIEAHESDAEREARLAERWSDELADLLRGVMEDLELSPEQQKAAEKVVAKHLTGGE